MRSVRANFLLLSAVIISLVLVLAGFMFVTLFSQSLERRVHEELKNHVNQLAAGIGFSANGKLLPPTGMSDLRFDKAYGGLYWQIDDVELDTRLRSRSLWDTDLAVPEDVRDVGSIHFYLLDGPDNTKVIVQERTIIAAAPGGTKTLRLAAALDQSVVTSARTRFLQDMIPYLLVLGALLLVGTWFQLKIGLRPLDRVAIALDDVTERKTARLEGRFPTEISRLTDAINDLLTSQEKALDKARKRSGDLAHSLKTPLTVIRSNAEKVAAKGDKTTGNEFIEIANQMEASIRHELLRSKLAPSPSARKSDADATAIIADIIRTLRRVPRSEHLEWVKDLPDTSIVAMDPHDLRELLGNILENASKWAATKIWIGGKILAEHKGLQITIEDDGPGMDANKIASMMDYGKRFDESTPGTGIGLSIVKDVMELYAIPVTIQNRQSQGLCVTATLPLADQHAGLGR